MGLSFVHSPRTSTSCRAARGAARRDLGIVLKIETRRAFEMLPPLLLAAMRGPAVGVMIARGDLAVECGFERLAEVQEEILWLCEAAHVPVIWATQVLESLAKEGVPSRAEITDAAMGERAECVMLNKGPHIVEAVRVLDDILRRMEAHQRRRARCCGGCAGGSGPMATCPRWSLDGRGGPVAATGAARRQWPHRSLRLACSSSDARVYPPTRGSVQRDRGSDGEAAGTAARVPPAAPGSSRLRTSRDDVREAARLLQESAAAGLRALACGVVCRRGAPTVR